MRTKVNEVSVSSQRNKAIRQVEISAKPAGINCSNLLLVASGNVGFKSRTSPNAMEPMMFNK